MAKGQFQKWFRKDNLVVLVLTGILLVIIALPTKDRENREGETPLSESGGLFQGNGEKESGEKGGEDSGQAGTAEGGQGAAESLWESAWEDGGGGFGGSALEGGTEDYAAYLEGRLTEVLSQMADVGKVKVMITLSSSRELVVEKERPVSRSSTDESDSQGGKRTLSQLETGDSTVYSTDGGVSQPYVVMTLPPQIEGVLVVAEGAGNGKVNRTITDIAQALFGVEAHKVVVVKMDSIYYSTSSYNEVVKGEEGIESEEPN